MPIVPFRDLGKLGVYTDIDPFDLPIGSFTMGLNCRFEDNKISRGPVFRTVDNSLTYDSPRFLYGFREIGGTPKLFCANADGRVFNHLPAGNGTASKTDISISGYTNASSAEPFTLDVLNNIVVLNREDRVPWFIAKGGSTFATLTNWDTNWRTKSIRSVNGQLVAINLTESGTAYPNRVRWSDFSVWGSVPGDWVADTDNSAGSNDLAELDGELIDGCHIRDRLALYTENEIWLMEPTGGNDVFTFRRAISGPGIINQNCAVEVDNLNYVFGPEEIYKFDGISKQDISTGRVNEFIYRNMDRSKSNQFFAFHNYAADEIMFCYVSADGFIGWPNDGTYGCNRAAVYNYRADTWYFYDLPYVTGMTTGVVNNTATYSGTSGTYDSLSSTYQSFADNNQFAVITAHNAHTGFNHRLNDFEPFVTASSTNPISPTECAPVLIRQDDMDLDELKAPLRGYKVVRSLYPEGRFSGSVPMTFEIGIKTYPNDTITWETAQTFDGSTLYKLDFNHGGRYLSYRATYDDVQPFTLHGIDFDLLLLGNR